MLPVAQVDPERGFWDGLSIRWVSATKRDYFDFIAETLEDPGSSLTIEEALEILGVCPAGFVDAYTAEIVTLESDASAYNVLPHGKGVLHETRRTMAAFRTVRAARDDFYIEEARRKKRKAKK